MGNAIITKHEDPYDWVLQHEDPDKYPLYNYVNVKKKGKLVDIYMREGPDGGEEAVEKVIREEIEPFLYNRGKGQLIREEGNIIQKKTKASGAISSSEITIKRLNSRERTFCEPKERTVCWDLEQRGGVGETALHLCVLHDHPVYTNIAKILLKCYPKMALDFYEGDEYYGESALHLAVVSGNLEIVRLLIENGADVNQRATGRFFLPEDQKKRRKKDTNYKGYAYYGEYPLAFAACLGHRDIYDYLMKHGADPNLQDSFGNTVLLMLVINNKTESWRYSNISCTTYPLAPLDTIGPEGQTNWNSVLIYITKGDTDEHLEMLWGDVIKQLLYNKWQTFARRHFIGRFLLLVLHLTALSIAVYCRPGDPSALMGPTAPIDIARYTAEIILCLVCLVTFVLESTEIAFLGFLGYLKNQMSAPTKALFNISCILITACIPLRFLGLYHVESALLALSAPCAWAFLLFFARGLLIWGPFVVMVYKMFALDHIRFCIILAILFVPFTQGFYLLFRDIDDPDVTSFKTLGGSAMQLFHMTFGQFEYEELSSTRHAVLTKIVFFMFSMLIPILLLNMLIAMMGKTYERVISRSEKEWWKKWAKCVIVLERTISAKQLQKYKEEYSVEMSDGRGLMVIKETAKTKAQQRNAAIKNWKTLAKGVKILIQTQKFSRKLGSDGKVQIERTAAQKIPEPYKSNDGGHASLKSSKTDKETVKQQAKLSEHTNKERGEEHVKIQTEVNNAESVVVKDMFRTRRNNKVTPLDPVENAATEV